MKVFIYGAGRVGRALGRAIQDHPGGELKLCGAWNRTFARAFETSRLLDVEVSAGDAVPDGLMRADVVILSVKDDVVEKTAGALARHLSHRQVLLHTSGSLPAQILDPKGIKAHMGCVHPLQALAHDDGDPRVLQGSFFAVEGDQEALACAERVALVAGGQPVSIASASKVYYHAAAVMAANYQTVLMDAACALMQEAGVDTATAVKMLVPLVSGTLSNLEALAHAEQSPGQGRAVVARALTGPVRRGDVGTVRKHMRAIDKLAKRKPEACADLPALYRALAQRATELAQQAELPPERAQALQKALGRAFS